LQGVADALRLPEPPKGPLRARASAKKGARPRSAARMVTLSDEPTATNKARTRTRNRQ
jgi:hypothetical protein